DPVLTYEVHGNIDHMRCSEACRAEIHPLPVDLLCASRSDPLSDQEFKRLRCPRCGAAARPHILWFDECYDEVLYRADSAIRAAATCDLLITIGTSGAAALPMHATAEAAHAGAAIVDINPMDNPFATFARESALGHWARSSAGALVPEIVEHLLV
ncbi:MAG TPA: RNA polymerase subunit sigma, partial [Nannocystis exedens]|nr:RNA polymerase subunit sigma [Nannocystis exedens]